jgi:hypothetical protein
MTRYSIEVPGQPPAEGEYLDEAEARSWVRESGLVKDMSTVKVTPADTPASLPPLDADALLADLAAFWAAPERSLFSGTVPGRIAGSMWDQPVPDGTENPYWEVVRQLPLEESVLPWKVRPEPMLYAYTSGRERFRYFADRFALCGTFSWSVCSPGDIAWMREILDGRAVVECGAGSGYWAWQMEQAGIGVAAYEPLEVADNGYVRREWTTLLRDDHSASRHHPDRALFLCWPSYDDPWAAQALACYEGDLLIFAGEGQGGCTADDGFFELREAGWDETGMSPAHVSHWGIHCELTAYRRKGTA